MRWDRHLKFVTDKDKRIPMYNVERSDNQFRLCCPPDDVPRLLWMAWTAMRPGMHSPSGRASVDEIAEYLRAMCISVEAAEWAAKKADEYYIDKNEFEEFVKTFR